MSLVRSLRTSYCHIYGIHRDPGNKTAVAAVEQFAVDLANRFSSIVGCTRSWDTANPNDFEVYQLDFMEEDVAHLIPFKVIIDNMMNLEVWGSPY